MKSLEYRDQVIDVLHDKFDIAYEEARSLVEKYDLIVEQGLAADYLPRWAAERIMEREG